jgi:hypothetical protein
MPSPDLPPPPQAPIQNVFLEVWVEPQLGRGCLEEISLYPYRGTVYWALFSFYHLINRRNVEVVDATGK